jgi:hypothetical protein
LANDMVASPVIRIVAQEVSAIHSSARRSM